jgi:hypothetical protein
VIALVFSLRSFFVLALAVESYNMQNQQNQGILHTLRTLCNVQYESYATCDARF